LRKQDLRARYGDPLVVLNLLKSRERRPREGLLRREYACAVALLNARGRERAAAAPTAAGGGGQTPAPYAPILYLSWDMSRFRKGGADVLLEIAGLVRAALGAVGVYVRHAPPPPGADADADAGGPTATARRLQRGVLRTNCIDCLDRTNVAQFAYGLAALGRCLEELGLAEPGGGADLQPTTGVGGQLMAMYASLGDALAWQYAGSEAHSVVFQRRARRGGGGCCEDAAAAGGAASAGRRRRAQPLAGSR